MFDNLSEKLHRARKVLKGEGSITEINIAETVKEIRKSLLDADVHYKVAKDFTDQVKKKALGQNVLNAIAPGQLFTKIMHDALTQLMGGTTATLTFPAMPTIILIAGLNGAGKTTFSGKLANLLKVRQHKKPLLVAADTYRPAAVDQLKILGTQTDTPVYIDAESKDPVAIAMAGVDKAKQHGHNVVLIDTAGRLSVDEAMMQEIKQIKEAIHPHEILFVVDAMIGQDAVNTAKVFNEHLDFTGVVLTKLDGDTRGGAALSIKSVVNKPIKFIGIGEKMDALDVFHPDRMAARILGMGDVVSLVERAQQHFDAQAAAELKKKIHKNKFDLDDFYKQIQQVKKMGNIRDLMGMIPNVKKVLGPVEVDEHSFKRIEVIIQSMTPYERAHPDAINTSCRNRIAKGSGTSVQDVHQLLKQFDNMKKIVKQLSELSTMAKVMKELF